MTSTEQVIQESKRLIVETPTGVRYSVLHKRIKELHPDIPANTIHGALHRFRLNLPSDIYLPSRGLYRNIKFKDISEQTPEPEQSNQKLFVKIDEEHFYSQFADWIVNELEECTKAIPLGGNKFKDKWGTPDIIGVREPRKSDIIKPPTEIISAEIKTDSQGLIVAFGQACSYKLFSHRSYIVVPDDSSEEDIARLDALSRIFGIGLILFDKKEKDADFEIRVRASRHEPDMFYVNKYMKLIEDDLFN
ncbi:MAG: hypothetical protein WAX69_08300 [Victivallales bacterium]